MHAALDRRNDAEGARTVTAIRDLEVGAGRADVAERRLWNIVAGGGGTEVRGDFVPLLGAERSVDARDGRAHLVFRDLGEATDDVETLIGAPISVEFANHLDRLVLRRVDEAAGVDDQQVGIIWLEASRGVALCGAPARAASSRRCSWRNRG